MPRPARKLPSNIADRWKKKRAREQEEEARWESLSLKKEQRSRQPTPSPRPPILADIVKAYISGTHGSLPRINYESVNALLTEDFVFENEDQRHDKVTLLHTIYPQWAGIVKGESTVRIHSIAIDENVGTVLAHWETDYDCRDGATWYGTNVDISGKKMRNFQVFASFSFCEGLISKIVQRSDTVVKKLEIEEQVRIAHESASVPK